MIGRTVSHYRILSELGSGGMGVVYRAEDLSLGRQVAIKFLSPQLDADPESRRRFLHEARAAAALDHSGICTVYETGDVDGHPFIVMAFIEGQTLRDRIARGPLPLPEAVGIAAQVAEALHGAHGKGVIHRDVKPANIMIGPMGQARIMDFGLAQLSGASRLTRSGTTLGTVAYLSPEQARGDDADRRTDIWSLGVVLYEMTAGVRPFQADREAAMMANLERATPAPLTSLRAGVPLELERIVAKCLEKESGRRYQHADELAVDLRRLQAELDETRTIAAPRRNRSSRLGFIGFGALLLALVAVALGAWRTLRPERTPSAAAALAVVDFECLGAVPDSLSASGLNGLLQVGLVERSPIRVVSPEYLQDLRRRLFAGEQGPIRADQALAVARKAGASLMLSGQVGQSGGSSFAIWRLVETGTGNGVGGRRVVGSDLIGLADDIIAQAVPLIADRAGVAAGRDTASVGHLTTTSPEAYRQFVAGELALQGSGAAREAAGRRFQAAAQLDSTFALAWARLADFHWSNTNMGPAKVCADRAWQLRARLGIKDRMMLESRRMQIMGQVDGAVDVYREMLSRWPDDRTVLQTYGGALYWWWLLPEARIVLEQGLDRYPDDEILGADLCEVCLQLDDLPRARAAALEFRRRHPDSARGWELFGELELRAGVPDSAEAAFERARNLEPDDFSAQVELARCAAARGQAGEAEAITKRILARTDLTTHQRAQIMAGKDDFGLVYLCTMTGRYREATDWAARAQQLGSNDGIERWMGQTALVSVLRESGQWRELLVLARQGRIGGVTRSVAEAGKEAEVARPQGFPEAWRIQALVQADSLARARSLLAVFVAAKDRKVLLARYLPMSTAAALALAEGHPDSALATLANLTAYHRLESREQELRARAQCALGRYADAAATLEALIRREGVRYTAHRQLAGVYERMERREQAVREYEIFLDGWRNADPGRPEVDDARRKVAALRGGS